MSKDFERKVSAVEPATPNATSQARLEPSQAARKTSQKDPVTSILWLLIAGAIIAILAFIVGALALGYLGSSRGAQTSEQASLLQRENDWKQSKDDPQAWGQYINALIIAKQYSKAQDMINQASTKFAKSDTYDYYAQCSQANLYYAKKDYEGAIKAADEVQKLMKDAYEKLLKKDVKPNKAKAYGISSNYAQMNLLKAGAYEELDKPDEAIKILEAYVKDHPTEAGVWYDLGSIYAEAGNKDKARSAFDKALQFMPDDKVIQKAREQLGDK